jgi:hypothetical protein
MSQVLAKFVQIDLSNFIFRLFSTTIGLNRRVYLLSGVKLLPANCPASQRKNINNNSNRR